IRERIVVGEHLNATGCVDEGVKLLKNEFCFVLPLRPHPLNVLRKMSDDPETVNAQDATDMPEVSAPPRVVGIGASAGGLEAFSEFPRHLPKNTGMSFVFVPHLEPKQTRRLTAILSRRTQKPVEVATEGGRRRRERL